MPLRNASLPNIHERHALQILLSGDWKLANALYPTQAATLTKMVSKGWIERRATAQSEYKITDAGRKAFRARLPEWVSTKKK